MIRSFRCGDTKALAEGRVVPRFVNIAVVARRKLRQMHIANDLNDLRMPPGSRLEPLKADRSGQYSIRINEQFRACFRWQDGAAEDVEIIDYH